MPSPASSTPSVTTSMHSSTSGGTSSNSPVTRAVPVTSPPSGTARPCRSGSGSPPDGSAVLRRKLTR